jgi:hypothetical protein
LEGVVDGVAASAALAEYLPVFASGDDEFDACCDIAVSPVAVVADEAAGAISPGCGDHGGPAVATVAEDVPLASQLGGLRSRRRRRRQCGCRAGT